MKCSRAIPRLSVLILIASIFAAAVPIGWVDDAIEAAIRVSKCNLDDAARLILRESLEEAAKRYGDDVLKAVARGGVELAEASARYGDDIWRWSSKFPGATRALALHADELVPLCRRVGPQVLKIEAHNPGLAARVASSFGDDTLRLFATHVGPDDAPRLLRGIEKANSPTARNALLKAYERTGGAVLKHLDWKAVLAGGLSVAMISAAHETADGIQEGMKTIASDSPETFKQALVPVLTRVTMPIWLGGSVFTLALAGLMILKVKRRWEPGPQTQTSPE
ncbi:MAG: hypothetical protein HN742_14070 [Lentisphaerae bacterium]|jgi:hypothetical protein|nr:hypothetical protein [Lentisphaerota bacterium]MBT5610607.1 hypothetical protein [Lentisphaerota bacterium]MBT7054484.1 hypothetical protein [Lentisphaerota bacterium]MBT7843001.1 hypothetical protein [Lentisphaerota bacterium]